MDTSNWTLEDHLEWQRHQAKILMVMERYRLNVIVATMLHYDLPWLNYEMSPHLDLLAIQKALLEVGPNPVLKRHPESINRKVNS